MKKTIVQFDLMRINEYDYFTDPNSLYVCGYINSNMLEELLTSPNYLNDMVDLEICESKTVTMKVWIDSDDFSSWLDYELLPDDFDLETEWFKLKDKRPVSEIDGDKILICRILNETQSEQNPSIFPTNRINLCDENSTWWTKMPKLPNELKEL